ncbi:MAG: carbohydrate ABC transporter permease [Clostridia bacterium]|nr:carbohydrate ABC transporter permease [Clostridia bacterium]
MKKKFNLFHPQYAARSWFVLFNTIFFIALMIIMIVPIFKIFCDSMVNQTVYGLNLLPRGVDPETKEVIWFNTIAYKRIITDPQLYHPFLVSIYTTLLTTFLGLLISTLGAYVLIQRDMPGVKFFGYALLFTMIFNAGLIPTFLVMKKVGLLDSIWAVIVPTSMNVYNLVLMRSFFEGIPASLFEAAEIDGCTPMGIFVKIVLPLSKAALASIGLFFAVAAWSEYFHYVIYIKSSDKYNFQYKLRDLFQDKQDASEGTRINTNTLKSAAVIVSIVPFMFIYPFCQKYFMTGVTMGAVKE